MGSHELVNPVTFPTITELLAAILNVVIIISTPIVVMFIIYSGFLYVTARGNAEQIKQASQALLYGIIGGVIILGSVAITAIVKNLAEQF
jgi:formate-dependent nitrite reductase membrane component NrfD